MRKRRRMQTRSSPALPGRLGGAFIALLLLLGVGAAVFLLFFRGYVTETATGRVLQTPFFAEERDLAAFSDETVATGEQAATDTGPTPLRAVLLPLSAVEEGKADTLLRRAGGNAVILDMKAESGALGYVSALPEAIEARASAADPARNETLRAFNREEGRYSIARISCFRDDAVAGAYPALSLSRVSGSLWRDEEGLAWLAPGEEAARAYLLAVCRELSALGFDELLLTNCYFPAEGRQTLLAEGASAAGRAEILVDFYRALQMLGEETGLTISILWTEGAYDAAGLPLNGQSLERAASAADRVWVFEGEEGALSTLSGGGAQPSALSLISIVSDPAGRSGPWAIF